MREANLPEGQWGAYVQRTGTVWLQAGMTRSQRVATLLHELLHVLAGHDGHQDEATERRIDEDVARVLVDAIDYSWAESQVGCHVGGLAALLEVPTWVVEAYQRALAGLKQPLASVMARPSALIARRRMVLDIVKP
mgnify:CR=1 FL=1